MHVGVSSFPIYFGIRIFYYKWDDSWSSHVEAIGDLGYRSTYVVIGEEAHGTKKEARCHGH